MSATQPDDNNTTRNDEISQGNIRELSPPPLENPNPSYHSFGKVDEHVYPTTMPLSSEGGEDANKRRHRSWPEMDNDPDDKNKTIKIHAMGDIQVIKAMSDARRLERKERMRKRWSKVRHNMWVLGRTLSEKTPLVGAKEEEEARGDASSTMKPVVGGGAVKPPDGIESVGEEEERPETTGSISRLVDMIFWNRISILLLFLPFGWLSHHLGWSDKSVFWLNFMGMIPLASILGDFTEELALHTNQVIGGLINATFGNAVEVVVAIQALMANEIRVVQASMLGSILSNLLLVLGCCFFFGGLKYREQAFNPTAATANISLLALSSIALVLPTPFAEYYNVQDEHVLMISRIAALFLMFMYFQLLLFQLKTHVDLFTEDDDDEVPELPFWVALTGLVIVTVMVSVFSDYLVQSIDGYVEETGISRTFVGIVVLPVVGNAVEHITAVSVAMKNKMDLSMGVAIGSSTQVSLFVVPFIIVIGWITDKNMTLNFPHFEIILYVLSIVIVAICLGNNKTNWLEGSLLLTTYAMIGVGFWFENVIDFSG